jgi:hypothetical protein
MRYFLNKFVRNKKLMFVGGSPKEAAEKLYGPIEKYIQTPGRYAYDSFEEYWPEIENSIDDIEVVIVSAGVASDVIAKRLWVLNKEIHLFDIGSIIDAVEGLNSRIWLRLLGHRIDKLLPKNLQNRTFKFWIKCVLKDIKYAFRRHIVR